MKTVYTDENKMLKTLGKTVDSEQFQSFLNDNLKRMIKYSYGIDRLEDSLARNIINEYFKDIGLFISTNVEHAHNIGNNNAYYVQDLDSGEYIGCLHLNTDMYGGMYLYASDVNKEAVSCSYFLSERVRVEKRERHTDWGKYKFEREEAVLINASLDEKIAAADSIRKEKEQMPDKDVSRDVQDEPIR